MATRFARVDLSDRGRDFRPVAVEPGVPLLDYGGANDKILFRWLGGMVAEPEWEGETVSFYVRDDHGGRLEEVACQPATAEDLEKLLEKDLATLRERIDKARPETATEREVKRTLRRSFEELVDDPNRVDQDNYFFRYKDAQGRWRLVWCWGYQRVDQEPAPAVVCTDPECGLLFVRRPGQSPKCPACEAALAAKPVKRTPWKRAAVLVLLLLLLGAGLYYWWTHPNRLIATPDEAQGPVGGRVSFKVTKAGLFFKEDVTGQAVGVVSDPRVARFDQLAMAATIVGPGKAVVTFHVGDLKCDATIGSLGAQNPQSIRIEPDSVELGIGTTARLKLIGKYDDGSEADLTDAAEWVAQNDGVVFSYEGLLEGLSEGTTTVAARYRASPDSDTLDATATAIVKDIPFKALELAIDPLPVAVGGASNLRIDAVSEEGENYSVLESSRLATEVSPDYRAKVDGRHLVGRNVGKAKLAATFRDELSAGTEFEVVLGPGLDGLVVLPKELEMVVGEITDLSVASPSSAPITFASSDPATLEIADENRLIARAEGQATVEVSQPGQESQSVTVTITKVDFASLAVDPDPVRVLVDHTVRARAMAKAKEGDPPRDIEIAPDLLQVAEKPSPRFADFDPRTLELLGVMPTDTSSPQRLALRLGDLEASAPVEVVVAPLRLALKPIGPVDLPLGQQMRLQGWANYSGGHRVQVPSSRLAFHAKETVEGLDLRGDRVRALKPKVGPLNVYAIYFGNKSNDVTFNSTEAGDVTLEVEVDRTLRLVGETGKATLRGRGPGGDVELVPDLATYSSGDTTVLGIAEKTGVFRTTAPGEAIVTGKHLAAKEPASVRVKVFDPANARLLFDPEAVRVAVDEVARLQLFLEVQDGGKAERAALDGPGVGFAMTQPQAVRYTPPVLVGLEPAAPFELSGSFYPHLSSTAKAQVKVVEAGAPQAMRIVPESAELAPGQTLTLRVEEQLPGDANTWREVRPGAVSWNVPSELVWTAPTAGLRPTLTMPEGAAGPFEISARYGEAEATLPISRKEAGPDMADPAARVKVVREPPGRYLPVGGQQRYAIVVEKDGVEEPAANVQWPEDFDNEYVRWQAPVLLAKRPGHSQWLRAEVDGRAVLLRTTTYEPGEFARPPEVEPGTRPARVEIVSDQGPSVQFPVGAAFDDFRVVAHYPQDDGTTMTRLVTNKAQITTSEAPEGAVVSAEGGRLMGLRPGSAEVSAQFEGVKTETPLAVTVTPTADPDQIRIDPAPLYLEPGESYPLKVYGYKQNKSIGDLSGLSGITWQSSKPDVARVEAGQVTGISEGQGELTAQLGGLASQPTEVIVGDVEDVLVVSPQPLRLRVGESVRLGQDVTVMRGNLDLSPQVRVTPALEGIVAFDPATRSLTGLRAGGVAVALTHGDKMANLMVEVSGAGGPIDGQVVVEPAAAHLIPGQALSPRVYVVTPEGERVDRTASALLKSSDPAVVTVQGTQIVAAGPGGPATITAEVAGAQGEGTASITVGDAEITELVIDPPQATLYVGDAMPFTVLGRSVDGSLRPIAPQPDLKVTIGGANPGSVQLAGGHTVQGVVPGEAQIVATWRHGVAAQAPVSVTAAEMGGLEIHPAQASLRPGQTLVYQVIGMKGGQRRALTKADGVELFVSDPSKAQVSGSQLAVMANEPGRTAVIAMLGDQEAEAVLDVTTGDAPPTGDELPGIGDDHIDDDGPGAGFVGDPDDVDHGYGYGDGHGHGHGHWGDGVDDVWGFRDDDGHYVWGPDGERIYVDDPDGWIRPPLVATDQLRFVPDVLRLSQNSPPTAVRVYEVLPDGTLGREVTNDPNLVPSQPPDTARVEKTETGIMVTPIGPGETTVGAILESATNPKTADPLLVQVGDAVTATTATQLARLVVSPNPLTLWAGQTGTFAEVLLDPGAGQPLRPVDFVVTPMPGQNVVASADQRTLRGLAGGNTQVLISSVDPAGVFDGLRATATVQVTAGAPITIDPPTLSLQLGQPAPPLTVRAHGPDGTSYAVPAKLSALDPSVLAPDPGIPGGFNAAGVGATQIRAEYQGREAFAYVQVTGKRFIQVTPHLVPGPDDFSVTLDILAEGTEGPLQYRVYESGGVPADVWTPSTPDGSYQKTELRSPRMQYKPYGSLYHLILESRPTSGGAVQNYPYTFRLRPGIEELLRPAARPGSPGPRPSVPEPPSRIETTPSPVPGFEGT